MYTINCGLPLDRLERANLILGSHDFAFNCCLIMKIANKLYQSGTWLITVDHQHVLTKAAGCFGIAPSLGKNATAS